MKTRRGQVVIFLVSFSALTLTGWASVKSYATDYLPEQVEKEDQGRSG